MGADTVSDDAAAAAEPALGHLDAYLSQIDRVALLSAEQEVELAKRIEASLFAPHRLNEPGAPQGLLARELAWLSQDGEDAKRQFIEANLRLVVTLAKRHAGGGMDLEDLIQEGSIGLTHAVEKFDYAKGFKFSTYATWWIQEAMTRAMNEQARSIRIPLRTVKLIRKLARLQRQVGRGLGRVPTWDELADEAGVPLEVVREAVWADLPVESLDTPVWISVEDSAETSPGLVELEPSARTDLIREPALATSAGAAGRLPPQLEAVLEAMAPREARVFRLRAGVIDGRRWTLQEVGDELGVTRERVRQIESRARDRAWRCWPRTASPSQAGADGAGRSLPS